MTERTMPIYVYVCTCIYLHVHVEHKAGKVEDRTCMHIITGPGIMEQHGWRHSRDAPELRTLMARGRAHESLQPRPECVIVM